MPKITRDFVTELARRVAQRQPFIQSVIGPRQVGKTSGVLELERLLNLPYHYCSADLPASPDREWIREQWNTARIRAEGGTGILVLDEVQKITDWSDLIKVMFDEERRRENPLQIIILGSASWTIQSGLNETLAGRFEMLRVPHWSFQESRDAFNWSVEQFLKFGGYPAPASLITEVPRWQQFIRDSIIEPMVARDLLTLRDVAKPALLRQTLQLALTYPAQEISVQKLLGQLQDRGNATTIKGYLELLEAGFVLKLLPKYSTRLITTKSSSPKIVPLSSALIHAFTPPTRFDTDLDWRGRVFEAAIGAQLAQIDPNLQYWRDGNDEVDFVIRLEEQTIGIEVKSGRKRRSTGLEKFRRAFPGTKTLLINHDIGSHLLSSKDPAKALRELVPDL